MVVTLLSYALHIPTPTILSLFGYIHLRLFYMMDANSLFTAHSIPSF